MILNEYLQCSFKTRKLLIKRLALSTLAIEVLFGIDIIHEDEFLFKQKEKILEYSDESIEDLEEYKYINKNLFTRFLRLNSINYKKDGILQILNFINVLLIALILSFIICALYIPMSIIVLILFARLGKGIRGNDNKIKMTSKGKKSLINLIYKDTLSLSIINDSLSGIIRRNKFLEDEFKYHFLSSDIEKFKRDLNISQ